MNKEFKDAIFKEINIALDTKSIDVKLGQPFESAKTTDLELTDKVYVVKISVELSLYKAK